MSKEDSTDIDPLADLDDDLGDDWESAFQSEDFMFSPDEEANDFFLFDENDSEEDVDELTSIMESAEKEVIEEQQASLPKDASGETTEEKVDSFSQSLPAKVLSQASSALAFFQARPLYQRAIAVALPCLILLLVISTLFFRSTTEEFAQTKDEPIVVADLEVGPSQPVEPVVKTPPPEKPDIILPQEEPPSTRKRTIRKQWDFPTFTIVSSSPGAETVFVNVNLSLIAILPEGGSLPEEKNVLVKDIIYQFYQNRSPQELKRFALARGEMIHKLHSWLKKEWPDSPVNTVIFSKYQVVRTPQTS